MAIPKQRPSWRTTSLLSLFSILFITLIVALPTIILPNHRLEFWVMLAIALITLALAVPGTIHAVRSLQSPTPALDLPAVIRSIQDRWTEAAKQRGLEADALEIAWSDTDRPVVSTRRPIASAEVPDDVTGLASYWSALPSPQQLVIIGPPGAGKTSAMILLATALLDAARTESGPIPVAVNLSGWNPVETDLTKWIVNQVGDEYPSLRRQDSNGVTFAASLLRGGTIVPFLDGLDEAVHLPRALERIDAAMGRRQRFVLTCRDDEYESAVLQRHESLTAAAVIELHPVDPEQAAAYLPSGNQLHAQRRWRAVAAELSANPSGPLAKALSTPLMVYLAQVAFWEHDDADELLGFDDPAAIEQRLLQAYLPAFYPRDDTAEPARRRDDPYTRQQAQRWLGFLATGLGGADRQGIAWWRFPAICGPAFVIGYVAMAALVSAVVIGAAAGPWYGLVFAVAIAFRIPAYSTPVISTKPFQFQTMMAAAACGVLCGTVAFATGGGLVASLVLAAATTMVVSSAIEAYQRHDVDDLPRTPVEVLREDLKHSLRLALSAGIAVFAAAVFMHGPVAGVIFGLVGAYAAGRAGYLDVGLVRGAIPGGLAYGMVGALAGAVDFAVPRALLLSFGIMSTIIALNVWYRSVIARLWLLASRKLPFQAIRFLEDAADRGVLRRTGAVYRFRHLRIQNHLASDSPTPTSMERHR